MKNIILFIIIILCPFLSKSQGRLRITWPAERSVFQRGTDGTANISFSGIQGYQSGALGLQSVSVQIFKLNPFSGQRLNTSPESINISSSNYGSYYSTPWGIGRLFKISIDNLQTGWYEAELFTQNPNLNCPENSNKESIRKVKFGIGDVFIIAGQSNASGYTYGDDNVTNPDYYVNNQPDAVNILNSAFETDRNYFNSLSSQIKIQQDLGLPIYSDNPNARVVFHETLDEEWQKNGTPYYHRFDKLDMGSEGKINDKVNIYPNGQSSWAYAPLAKKMFDAGNQAPVMFFNAAIPGSHSKAWKLNNDSDWVYHQFRQTVQMYGRIFGLRRILWHQGESDNGLFGVYSTTAQYTDNINSLIDQLNTDMGFTDPNGYKIPWTVSKASFDGQKSPQTRTEVRTAQQNIGMTSPNNVGPDTDDIGVSGRASAYKVHFNGITLDNVGEKWRMSNIQTGIPLSGQPLQNLTVEPYDTNNFKLSAPAGFTRYIWVLNNNGIFNSVQNSTSNFLIVPKTLSEVRYYMCYMSNENDTDPLDGYNLKLSVSQPFVIPNSIDAQKSLSAEYLSKTFTSQQSSANLKIVSSGQNFNVTTNRSWITLGNQCGFDGDNSIAYSVSQNSTSSLRSGSIFIEGENSVVVIDIDQTPSSGDISLTSLTPTSASVGWGSINYSGLNVGGNDIYISGIKYTQGIGTHAQSHITYNIPSGYQYFKGKVGRDDAADGCNCGDMLTSFTIKLNGATVWNSGQHGISTPAEDFNVNLNGSGGTLELINNAGANNWGDWSDWVNIYLSNTSGSSSIPAPIAFSANPNNLTSAGNTTLSATCNTGTVTWSTGQTGSPVSTYVSASTNFTVKCVSGSQESDPRNVSVTVSGGGACSVLTNNLVIGTWNVTGHQLVSRYFHSDYWLVQKVNVNGSSYDEFVVRAGEMLQRSDVSLNNGSYSGLVNCYALEYSAYGGLLGPNHSSTVPFATPTGYSLYYASDGTPYYSTYNTSSGAITNGGCYRIKSVANNKYLQAIGGDFNEYHSGNTGNDKIWKFTTSDNTNWKIKSASGDGKYLYAEGTYCGARVKRTSNTSQANQLWQFDQNGSDFRFFLPNGTTWDHEGASTLNNLQVCGDNTQGYQTWRLVSLEGVSCPSGVRVGNAEAGRIEETELPLLTIAPNPTDGLIHVSLNANQEGPAVLNLIDITGKKYLEHSLMAKKGLNQFDIDATWASPGTYLLQAITGDKTGSQRVVIE